MKYKALSKKTMLNALKMLSDSLEKKGIKGELCICGGAALLLAFDARDITKDVDSVFKPAKEIREAAAKVAEELDLPNDWINDGVKAYLDPKIEPTSDGMPQFKNLKITRPSNEYLFYMKCMASRIGDESSDIEDIKFLGKLLDIKSSDQALSVVEKYSNNGILPKVEYLLMDIFDSKKP